MPFFAQEHVPIPTKDILSWIWDEPLYDQEKPIFIDVATEESISASKARSLVRQLVSGFKRLGLQRGDCVCIHAFNNLYYPILVLGIVAAGGVYTGTNPSNTQFELEHYLKVSGAKFVISEPGILDALRKAASKLSIPDERLLILPEPGNDGSGTGLKDWRTLLGGQEEDWVRFDDLETSRSTNAMLLFSSGTTGLPKAVQLTHHNFVAQQTVVYDHDPRPYPISRLVCLPMFHAATAPSAHTGALRSGHTLYIMRRFETSAYLSNLVKYSITELIMVPPMVHAILAASLHGDVKKYFRHVRNGWVGAAPLDAESQRRFQALLPASTPFTQVDGMTETCCFASVLFYPEHDSTASVGRWLPNLDVKLIDDEGVELKAKYNTRGELCIRGPTITRGYLNNAEANAKDFDDDGFFHTGDVLYCDAETKLWYIVDRKKELIKVRGFQVAPIEIEGEILSMGADILDTAVIGLKVGGMNDELPRAYVVRRSGSKISESDIKAHLATRLAKYKGLEGGVVFVDAIPKSPSGKILKRLLRDQAQKEMGAKL